MTIPDLTWSDDDLIAAGFDPSYWDRHGNPVPATWLHTLDDIEAIEHDGAIFIEQVQAARADGRLTPDESPWPYATRLRAGLVTPNDDPRTPF